MTYRDTLNTFDEHSLPNLDVAVMGALELFAEKGIPASHLGNFKRPLVIGSGNGAVTGRILFDDSDAVFADESNFERKLDNISEIDGVVLISASGSKHALSLAHEFKNQDYETMLLTNNPEAPAKQFIDDDKFFVFPKNREPYTYNTSTYMGMILGKTKEDPAAIKTYIEEHVDNLIPDNFADYDAFYILVPETFDAFREMLMIKFDELFQPKVSGRVFTPEQSKHAKSVVTSEKELFISFGEKNETFGLPGHRLHIPLPEDANYGAMMAISYYVIGKIQAQLPPYFKQGIEEYVKHAGDAFGITLGVIVE